MTAKSTSQMRRVKVSTPNQDPAPTPKSKQAATPADNVIDLKSFSAATKGAGESNLTPMSPPVYGSTMRAYSPVYHSDCVNHCPGCNKTHWLVGRTTAECAFCGTALPLAVKMEQSNAPRFTVKSSKTAEMTQRTQ
jgi:hypothetical protein